MPKLLIIEDNKDMRDGLTHFFEREGFSVVSAASCEDGIDIVDEEQFDVGIIDINLPGKSGFELIDYIRGEGKELPLIAMTARDSIDDKLKGFELGLTDYIVKPFDRKEILARVDVHLKRARSQSNEDEDITTKNFSLSPSRFELRHKGSLIELTKIEFRMMQILMRDNHAVVSIDDLISSVWGEQEGMVNPPVRIHIGNLRKKIGDSKFKLIKTIPAVGYIFNDPVEAE